jgi:hypothetical protein
MKKLLALILTAALPFASLGCGVSDKDKGINSNKDMPRTAKGG